MSSDLTQAMLFGLTLSEFVQRGISPSEYNANRLSLSKSTLDIVSQIKMLNLVQAETIVTSDKDNLISFIFITYIYRDSIEKLIKAIRASYQQASVTASRLSIVALTKCILEDIPAENCFPQVWEMSSGVCDDYDMTIRKIGHVLGWGSEVHAIRHLGTGETSQEIMTLALYCVLRHPNNYILAIRCAMKTSKNNEIIVSIVGALMGAQLGLDKLPQAWVKHCQNRKYILKLAQELSQIRE